MASSIYWNSIVNHSRFLFFILLVFLCHCTTPPPPVLTPTLPKSGSSYQTRERTTRRYNDIDMDQLHRELRMGNRLETLGYQERAFNTCQVQANRSPNPYCQQLYYHRLNFQVLCRDSTGTVSHVNLSPLTTQNLRWKSGRMRGRTSTNGSGYGTLSFISQRSSRHGHLYLSLGRKMARKKLSDRWKLILPQSWCLSR
ncbi:MAG: hypothetical protein AAF203_04145 [Pseudomonadota bacterium]